MKSVRGLADLRLANAADCAETFLELVDAAFGIDELFLSGEERMRVGGDAGGNHGVLDAVDGFLFLGGLGGAGDETCARGHVNEDDRIVLWMEILFHVSWLVATRSNARGGEDGENGRGVKFLNLRPEEKRRGTTNVCKLPPMKARVLREVFSSFAKIRMHSR